MENGLAGGGKRLRSKGVGLAPVAGMLAIVCCLGGVLWCVQAGFLNRPAQQAPGPIPDSLFYPLHLSVPVQEEEEDSQEAPPEAEEPDPQADRFVLSFAGDCTLGAEHDTWNRLGNFPDVVGDDYAYPLAGVKHVFAEDDFTFVNLECALTDADTPADKTYRFRGLPAYGQILTEGSVEGVTLANNHSLDYGAEGLADTRQVLAELGIGRRRRWGDLPLYHGPRLEGGRLYRLPSGPYTDSEGDYILAGGRSRSGHCSLPFRDRGFLYAYGEPEEFVPLCY